MPFCSVPGAAMRPTFVGPERRRRFRLARGRFEDGAHGTRHVGAAPPLSSETVSVIDEPFLISSAADRQAIMSGRVEKSTMLVPFS